MKFDIKWLVVFAMGLLTGILTFWYANQVQLSSNDLTYDMWMKKTHQRENNHLPVFDTEKTVSTMNRGCIEINPYTNNAFLGTFGASTIIENNCRNMRLKCLLLEYDELYSNLKKLYGLNTEISPLIDEAMTRIRIMFGPLIFRLQSIKNNSISCRNNQFNRVGSRFYFDLGHELSVFHMDFLSRIGEDKYSKLLEAYLLNLLDILVELGNLCDGKFYYAAQINGENFSSVKTVKNPASDNCVNAYQVVNNLCYEKEVLGKHAEDVGISKE